MLGELVLALFPGFEGLLKLLDAFSVLGAVKRGRGDAVGELLEFKLDGVIAALEF